MDRIEPPGAGSPSTWTDVYLAERDQLVRLAYLMTGSQAVAEDLVQDTFIRVMAKLSPGDGPGAYLRRSVINACYSWHRRAWREVHTAREDGLGDGGGGAREPVQAAAVADVEMWDALNRLPARRRAILVLRFYLDMSEADVAATLGCRVGTVKSTTHRALAELRKMIER